MKKNQTKQIPLTIILEEISNLQRNLTYKTSSFFLLFSFAAHSSSYLSFPVEQQHKQNQLSLLYFTQWNRSKQAIPSAIDFGPYSEALANIRHYSIFVRNSMHIFSESLRDVTDKKHQRLLNMTWHDVNNTADSLDHTYTKFVNLVKIMKGQILTQKINLAIERNIEFSVWHC